MIKELFLDIKNRLTSLEDGSNTPIFSEVDLFKNQPSTPAVITGFPAAYIDFPYSCYKDSSAKIQLGNITVKILLCFDVDLLSNSEDVLEIKDAVYSAIQGEYLEAVQPPAGPAKFYAILTRSMEHTNVKYPGLYVYELDFYTMVKDFGNYRMKNFTQHTIGYTLTKDIVSMSDAENLDNNLNTTQQILNEE